MAARFWRRGYGASFVSVQLWPFSSQAATSVRRLQAVEAEAAAAAVDGGGKPQPVAGELGERRSGGLAALAPSGQSDGRSHGGVEGTDSGNSSALEGLAAARGPFTRALGLVSWWACWASLVAVGWLDSLIGRFGVLALGSLQAGCAEALSY